MPLKDRWRKWKEWEGEEQQSLDDLRNKTRYRELKEDAEDRKDGNDSLSIKRKEEIKVIFYKSNTRKKYVIFTPHATADIHGAIGCDQKILKVVWGDTNSSPGPYPSATICRKFHVCCRLGRELFNLPSYFRRCSAEAESLPHRDSWCT